MENESYEVLQVQQDQNVIQVDAIERANVDSQVATAKQYPRDVRRCVDNSIVINNRQKDSTELRICPSTRRKDADWSKCSSCQAHC